MLIPIIVFGVPVFVLFLLAAAITGRWEFALWGWCVVQSFIAVLVYMSYKNNDSNNRSIE